MSQILVVEDEQDLSELVVEYLQAADYQTHLIESGHGVVEWVRLNNPALIVLDLMLPGKDGLTLCQEIREFSAVPIIMATARVEDVDRLIGLEIGADDYLCKPYNIREMVARVKAVLRRCAPLNDPKNTYQNEQQNKVQLDQDRLTVAWQNNQVQLSAVEFGLLRLLHASPGRIYGRSQMIDLAYKDARVVSERTVDSHIKNLRKKLQQLKHTAELIRSVYGVGYTFDPC